MATTRDRIWTYVLAHVKQKKDLTVQETMNDLGVAERTARGVLEEAARSAYLLDVTVERANKRIYRPKVEIVERNEL